MKVITMRSGLISKFMSLCILLIGSIGIFSACGGETTAHKVIVLGVDGMDYKMLKAWIDAGKMPNLEALSIEGSFAPLGTSIPPESPVAWSNFISGQNPGGHGIFDFLHREFKDGEVLPCFSMASPMEVTKSITLAGYEFPISVKDAFNKRQGRAFWEVLEDHDVPAVIFKIPCQSPPTETDQKTLSGMGTPDVRGDYGNYTIYTDDSKILFSVKIPEEKKISVSIIDNTIRDLIYGPDNALKAGLEKPKTSTPLTIYLDPEEPRIKLVTGDEDGTCEEIIMDEGEWSDFVQLDFEMFPLPSISGITRFYLKSVRPQFTLFVDSVNVNPYNPAIDITTPSGWAQELAERYGGFYTCGMPENPQTLREGALTYDEYKAHSLLIYNRRKSILLDMLDRHTSGLLFFYFSSVDLDSHMFWRCMDQKHPGHNKTEANEGFIEWLYKDLDQMIGEVRKKLSPEDTLIVMSDHGFAPYYRSIHLNTWLLENGYAALKEGADRENAEYLTAVDWTKTRAYNIGFASLYLNVKGREPQGIVDPADVEDLTNEICSKLMKLRDPENDKPVFLKMYKTREVYSGDHVSEAPEIIVGCKAEYRISDESTLGKFPENIIEDNMDPWSGCHLMAAEEVPGILLTNKKITLEDPKLYDLTATILKEYGIEKLPEMIGRPIFP
ncbi:MAG: alkaline phosphatase family protein [Planctomycetes bacterium]|nr:alkaline phosphatase family protein [Planctomycetota bacterium]